MLEKLFEVISNDLPALLQDVECWDSLIINRRKPYTYRVFTILPCGMRVCLHKFDICSNHEAFLHPHPWSAAFVILEGSYMMNFGVSKDSKSSPDILTRILFNKHSAYEMITPNLWHSIIPIKQTFTVMINSEEFEKKHDSVRQTKGKDLEKMPKDFLVEHLSIFSKLVHEFNNRS